MYGGIVCPVSKEVVRNPWQLEKWIRDKRINIMHFVPSPFHDLRWLIFSGEALPPSFIQKWVDQYGMATGLANLYGPTEASIDVTCHIIEQRPGFHGKKTISIGKAMNQVYIKILDQEMMELPDDYQMGRELFENHPVFKDTFLHLDGIVEDLIGHSIVDELYNENNRLQDPFHRTLFIHPAIFMVEYALARVLLEEGIDRIMFWVLVLVNTQRQPLPLC